MSRLGADAGQRRTGLRRLGLAVFAAAFLLLLFIRMDGMRALSGGASRSQAVGTDAPVGSLARPTFGSAGSSATPSAPSGTDAILVGAGNIADCTRTEDEATAALIAGIGGTVYTLGDNVYESGSAEEYANCYDPSWGQFRDRTRPTPGNREYTSPGATAYFDYFSVGSTKLPQYYAYDVAGWRIYAINSEIDVSARSPEVTWLRKDLAANPHRCVLAYWHEPRFSSAPAVIGTRLNPLWQALTDAGAEVILNAHHHFYERFAPQTPTGALDEKAGIREFVVGTGGKGLHELGQAAPNSEVRNNTTYGVLKLSLHDRSYDWQFVPVTGATFTDAGTASCHT